MKNLDAEVLDKEGISVRVVNVSTLKPVNEEELRSLVDSERETGVLEEGERDMIHGVFGFHDRVVREVMVPRVASPPTLGVMSVAGETKSLLVSPFASEIASRI